MKKLSKRRRKLIRATCLVLIVLLFIILGWVVLKWWDGKQVYTGSESSTGLEKNISYQGKEYVRNEEIETILVLGLDEFSENVNNSSYKNNQQADFVMLLVVDNEKKTCSAIHINRDTMTDVDVLGVSGGKIDTVNAQLALSYAYGNGGVSSCHNTENSVSKVLCGLDIDHVISITMDAVPAFNDLVGGVEVEVMDDFSAIDKELVKGKTVTLTGEQAVTYVRSREHLEDSTNDRRMERQRQYLNALYDTAKLCVEKDDTFIIDAAECIDGHFVSDYYDSATRMQELMERLSQYDFKGISSLEGESKKGEEYMEFYPDEEAVKELIVSMIYLPKK